VESVKQGDREHEDPHEGLVSRAIMEGTFSAIGEDFLRMLVCALAARLEVRYAFVTECREQVAGQPIRLRTRALWMGSKFGDNFEYSVVGTPCEHVLESRDCVCFPDSLTELFPEDDMLTELRVQSYIGVPLFARGGDLLGHLAVMDDRPMKEGEGKLRIMRAFAMRAAEEMQRLQTDREQQRRVVELTEAMKRVLPGMMAICAWCKRIRDEQGKWDEPEVFIRKHTETTLTHGICPDCFYSFFQGPHKRR